MSGKVDFQHNPSDIRVAVLAQCGLYGRVISQMEGVTLSQVYYRARKAGIKFRDFHEGKSWASKLLVEEAMRRKHLRSCQQAIIEYINRKEKEREQRRRLPAGSQGN